jgi:hypothetical protein|nr:MAG TPA: tail fiber protein [Caudoviricetes sp.]
MALSRQVIPSDGTTTQYPIAFADGYLSRDEVYVYEEFADDTPDAPIDFTFINDNLIQLGRVPPVGNSIVIERRVEASARKVIFIPQYIKSSDLNTMYKHLLYLAQAILDGRWEGSFGTNLDMGGNRIINVGKPVNDNDAVRLIDISTYTNQAQSLLDQTKTSQAAAKVSETNAKASEVAAKKSEDTAANSVEEARKWAVGSQQERPEGSSKYWAEEAKKSADSVEGDTIKKIGYENVREVACDGEVTVKLQDTDEIVSLRINNNTTITFDVSELTFPKFMYTVQFFVYLLNGPKTISFNPPTGRPFYWINGNTPDFSSGKAHWLVLRTGENWSSTTMSDAGEEG